MIDLCYWPTPNGHKITMFLEEADLPYRLVPVDIGAGEQFRPEFLAISPNNRISAIVDHSPADGRRNGERSCSVRPRHRSRRNERALSLVRPGRRRARPPARPRLKGCAAV